MPSRNFIARLPPTVTSDGIKYEYCQTHPSQSFASGLAAPLHDSKLLGTGYWLLPASYRPTLVAAATATGGATGSAPRQLLGLRVLANPDPATATAELLHVLRSQSGNHSATARPTTTTSASWPASMTATRLRTKVGRNDRFCAV